MMRMLRTLKLFQSTHPLRGATLIIKVRKYIPNISIHAPLAGCDVDKLAKEESLKAKISIHAPLAGCDKKYAGKEVTDE